MELLVVVIEIRVDDGITGETPGLAGTLLLFLLTPLYVSIRHSVRRVTHHTDCDLCPHFFFPHIFNCLSLYLFILATQ